VYFKDRVYAFQEFHVVVSDGDGIREGESKDFSLNAPRELDRGRTQYAALDARGETGLAFCDLMSQRTSG
jgi:hypothetical protein